MILDEIRSIKTGKNDLRKFGLMIGIILCFVGGYMVWKNHRSYIYFFIVSAFFFAAGLMFPAFLRSIYKIWMTFAILVGWVMTRVILVILFYVICTPIALLARICGNKFLDLNLSKSDASYWKYLHRVNFDKKRLRNQF